MSGTRTTVVGQLAVAQVAPSFWPQIQLHKSLRRDAATCAAGSGARRPAVLNRPSRYSLARRGGDFWDLLGTGHCAIQELRLGTATELERGRFNRKGVLLRARTDRLDDNHVTGAPGRQNHGVAHDSSAPGSGTSSPTSRVACVAACAGLLVAQERVRNCRSGFRNCQICGTRNTLPAPIGGHRDVGVML